MRNLAPQLQKVVGSDDELPFGPAGGQSSTTTTASTAAAARTPWPTIWCQTPAHRAGGAGGDSSQRHGAWGSVRDRRDDSGSQDLAAAARPMRGSAVEVVARTGNDGCADARTQGAGAATDMVVLVVARSGFAAATHSYVRCSDRRTSSNRSSFTTAAEHHGVDRQVGTAKPAPAPRGRERALRAALRRREGGQLAGRRRSRETT